jgi:hypothetical protein
MNSLVPSFHFLGVLHWYKRYVQRLVKTRVVAVNKGGKASYREALPPFVRYAQAERVCLLGSTPSRSAPWASSSIDAGFMEI